MSNEMTSAADLLKSQIRDMAQRVESTGGDLPIIRVTQDKHFLIPPDIEKKVEGPIEVVVYDFINQNQYFKKAFVKGEENIPDCWAQAYNIKDLAPDPELVEEPINPDCETCPLQEWGSGPNGGRACQNRRKIALRLANDPNAPILLISASKTAVPAFDKLVDNMAKNELPLCKVTMELGFNPAKDFPSILLTPKAENENFEADAERLHKARQMLEQKPRPKEKDDK